MEQKKLIFRNDNPSCLPLREPLTLHFNLRKPLDLHYLRLMDSQLVEQKSSASTVFRSTKTISPSFCPSFSLQNPFSDFFSLEMEPDPSFCFQKNPPAFPLKTPWPLVFPFIFPYKPLIALFYLEMEPNQRFGFQKTLAPPLEKSLGPSFCPSFSRKNLLVIFPIWKWNPTSLSPSFSLKNTLSAFSIRKRNPTKVCFRKKNGCTLQHTDFPFRNPFILASVYRLVRQAKEKRSIFLVFLCFYF